MSDYPEHIGKLIREYLNKAYERELHRELARLDQSFAEWRSGSISSDEINKRIHQYEIGPSHDLYEQYNSNEAGTTLAYAIVAETLIREEIPAELLAALDRQLNFHQSRKDRGESWPLGKPGPARITIRLNNNRMIGLETLNQGLTYAGLLEGLPTKGMNDQIIESAVKRAKQKHPNMEPYLIKPIEQPIEWRLEKPYVFGPPVAIPHVECQALFGSSAPARDQQRDFSSLVVIWYQSAFALPIDEQIVEQIKAIDWETAACDDDV